MRSSWFWLQIKSTTGILDHQWRNLNFELPKLYCSVVVVLLLIRNYCQFSLIYERLHVYLQGWTKPNAFHVCITSYKLVIQDHQAFRRKKWKYFILDEVSVLLRFIQVFCCMLLSSFLLLHVLYIKPLHIEHLKHESLSCCRPKTSRTSSHKDGSIYSTLTATADCSLQGLPYRTVWWNFGPWCTS